MTEQDWTIPLPEPYWAVVDRVRDVAIEKSLNAYVVGGFVRDLIMGRTPSDIDFSVEGQGNAIKLAQLVSKKYGYKLTDEYGQMGTVKMVMDGVETEFAMMRREIEYPADSRTPVIVPGTPEDDAKRRDFTVNALFLRLNDMKLMDLTGYGLQDIEDKVIRVSDPDNIDRIFDDDPLRLLRAIRFQMKLGFNLNPETLEGIKRNVYKMDDNPKLSVDKMLTELRKIMQNPKSGSGWRTMMDVGMGDKVIPKMRELEKIEQPGKHHGENALEHSLRVLENIPEESKSEALRLAALLHDLGKLTTQTIETKIVDGVEQQVAHFFDHAEVSVEMATQILRGLHFPEDIIADTVKLIAHHMALHEYKSDWSDGAIRRLAAKLGDKMSDLFALTRADVLGTDASQEMKEQSLRSIQEAEDRYNALQQTTPSELIESPLNGNELMEMFSMKPGRWLKEMKECLTNSKLDNPNITKDEAVALAKEYAQSHPELFNVKASWTWFL